jgi:hypothetical protein
VDWESEHVYEIYSLRSRGFFQYLYAGTDGGFGRESLGLGVTSAAWAGSVKRGWSNPRQVLTMPDKTTQAEERSAGSDRQEGRIRPAHTARIQYKEVHRDEPFGRVVVIRAKIPHGVQEDDTMDT